MKQNSYVFRITPMGEEYLPQISYALEKRTEKLSRNQYPGMWEATDQLRASAGKPSRGSKIFRKLLSIFCLCCGVFLFVPGLMRPEELRIPLIAGVIGIAAGVGGLLRGKMKRKNPFDKSAQLFLAQRKTTSDAKAVFSEDGMTIVADGEEELIPYDKMEYIIETAGMLLITFDGNVIAVKKDDMVSGEMVEFRSFISDRAAFVAYR